MNDNTWQIIYIILNISYRLVIVGFVIYMTIRLLAFYKDLKRYREKKDKKIPDDN
jgi:hypothetical protein